MKKEHKNKIKTFLKKQGSKINIPFLDTLFKRSNVDVISKNLLSVLPNLEFFDDSNENFEKYKSQNIKKLGSFYINSLKGGNLVKGNIQIPENYLKTETKTPVKVKNKQKTSSIDQKILQNNKFEPKQQEFLIERLKTNPTTGLFDTNLSKTNPTTGLFDTNFEQKTFTGNFVIPKQTKIKYGMEWRIVSGPKTSKFLVNAPKKDKQKLLEMVQTKKINNKIQKISGNEYLITLPAYAEGKNLLSFGQTLLKSTGSVASKFLTATGNFTKNIKNRLDAKLNTVAKTAGGNEPPVITVIGEGQNKEAAIAGESGKERIVGNSVIPENISNSQQNPTQTQQQIPQPTQVDQRPPEISNTDQQSNQQSNQQSQTQQVSQQETKRQNTAKGFDTLSSLSNAAMLIPGIGQIGMVAKGLSLVSKLGSVGKMMSLGGKVTSGGSILGKAGSVLSLGGGSSSDGGSSESGEQKEEGKPQGKSSELLGSLGSALPGAVAAGGILAAGGAAAGLAVGAVGAGVGAAAKGLSALASGVGNLLGLSENNDESKKANAAIAQDNRVTNTTFNNIVHQYDIYRKTADDSFMLPNHRREYG